MNVSKNAARIAVADAADQTRTIADAVSETGATVAAEAETIALGAREALAEMRRIIDDFAAATGAKADDAVAAVSATTAETAERLGSLVEDARTLGKDGLDTMAEKVAARPFTALAVAAGIGLALGFLTRPETRR